MFWKFMFIIAICFSAVFQGCGVIEKKKDAVEAGIEKRAVETAQYQPYRERNTLEGYEAFIEKHPDSHLVPTARREMDALRYAPYEKRHSISGYQDFISKYPENHHVAAARRNIETLAFQEAEKKDTIGGYSEFLSAYPLSHFDCEASERLHELKFRHLHDELEGAYRFDLLLYRLALKRRQNELNTEFGDFKCSASLVELRGEIYFNTRLIYRNDPIRGSIVSGQVSGELFDSLLSGALAQLFSKFRARSKIAGFSFEVATSPFGFCREPRRIVQYYFPMEAVDRFFLGSMRREELLTSARVSAE